MEKKQQGRPATGVPKKTVQSFVDCLEGWIKKKLLARWLKNVDQDVQAIEAYEQMDLVAIDRHDHLTLWCQTWLTDEGWNRLQANARQNRYKAKEKREGPKHKRVSMERDTAVDLEYFAKRRGITVTEAVQRLLQSIRP